MGSALIFTVSIGMTIKFAIYLWRARVLKVIASVAATQLANSNQVLETSHFAKIDSLQQFCPALFQSSQCSLRSIRLYHAALKIFGSANWAKSEMALCAQYSHAVFLLRVHHNQAVRAEVCSC